MMREAASIPNAPNARPQATDTMRKTSGLIQWRTRAIASERMNAHTIEPSMKEAKKKATCSDDGSVSPSEASAPPSESQKTIAQGLVNESVMPERKAPRFLPRAFGTDWRPLTSFDVTVPSALLKDDQAR